MIYMNSIEKLFSTISILQTNLFRIDLPKVLPTYRKQMFNPWPKNTAGKTSHKARNTTADTICIHIFAGRILSRKS